MKQPIIPGLGIVARTLFCIGRNYQEHAREMNSPVPEEPMVFLKPLSALCFNEATIPIPAKSNNVHFEAEVVVAIGKEGKNISPDKALEHVAGYGVGIDFTARDLQKKAKQKGHPWSVAKGFDSFAPVSTFLPKDEVSYPGQLQLQLTQNGEIRQQGNTSDLIFPIETLISYLSEIFTLCPGDLIFTGTPSGVGPVHKGDLLEVTLNNGRPKLTVTIDEE
ncbi:MAG: fumarylacetoacetate hydrolase family protein [Balneolaceae bacterium]|nr:fumarylacetoacetate hydrolase family protein [Balneolaceae bacterium]